MNEQQLDLDLGVIGADRRRVSAPAELRASVLRIPATAPRQRGFLTRLTRRFQTIFSATRSVAAGVIVALFGGLLLISQPFEQQRGVPGTASSELGGVSPTGSLALPRYGHTATLLSDGRVLVVGGCCLGEEDGTLAEIWDPGTGSFTPAGSLAEGRAWHTATLLPDGRVLAVGGSGGDHQLASAEVWDPASATFTPAGTLAESRFGYTATLLPDGHVLIIGNSAYGSDLPATAEVWDPATSTFSPLDLVVADDFGATVLADGRVLIIGKSGYDDYAVPTSAEVWDPATSTFTPAGSPTPDTVDDATLLPDGRVLFVGPRLDPTASVWDPATSTFSPTGSPAMDSISNPTLLPDGRVLVSSGGDPNSAEVWDPDTGTFGPAGSLPAVKGEGVTATALEDGRLVIIGGCSDPEPCSDALASVEVWDPVSYTFGAAGSLAEARLGHSATLLPDGRVLVVGGWGGDGEGPGRGVHDSAEVWAPGDP